MSVKAPFSSNSGFSGSSKSPSPSAAMTGTNLQLRFLPTGIISLRLASAPTAAQVRRPGGIHQSAEVIWRFAQDPGSDQGVAIGIVADATQRNGRAVLGVLECRRGRRTDPAAPESLLSGNWPEPRQRLVGVFVADQQLNRLSPSSWCRQLPSPRHRSCHRRPASRGNPHRGHTPVGGSSISTTPHIGVSSGVRTRPRRSRCEVGCLVPRLVGLSKHRQSTRTVEPAATMN